VFVSPVYSPTLGRFITTDPIGFQAGDENLYRFVSNNPTNAVDPSGLSQIDPTKIETQGRSEKLADAEFDFGGGRGKVEVLTGVGLKGKRSPGKSIGCNRSPAFLEVDFLAVVMS